MRLLKTLALLLVSSTFALAAKPIFEVPETGMFDRAYVTLGVVNDTDKELKVDKKLCEGLTVTDKDGKALPMTTCEELPGPTLAAGESRSTRINLIRLFPGLSTPGRYSVEWKHPAFQEAPKMISIEIVSEYAEVEVEGFGTLYIRFYRDQAPKTVENFKKLVTNDFYKNLTFHRIIKGFMMQGGCPRGDGTGDPGYKFEDEPSTVPHTPGVLSMANSGKNTNGSQFFICFNDAPFLNGRHTTFAKVIEGMDVVNKVEHECRVPDQQTGRPVKPPVMKTVKWHEAPK